MTKVINTKNSGDQLPLATDAECKVRRALLVASGAIKPAGKAEVITKKDGSQVLSTRRSSRAWRNKLIEQGLIDPNMSYESPSDRSDYIPSDEGEYSPKPVESDEEYARRKHNYLWMIADILRTRRELKLILGKKSDNDPDWYF